MTQIYPIAKTTYNFLFDKIFINVFAGMDFNCDDRVCMFLATQKVAIGCVCEVDPNAY